MILYRQPQQPHDAVRYSATLKTVPRLLWHQAAFLERRISEILSLQVFALHCFERGMLLVHLDRLRQDEVDRLVHLNRLYYFCLHGLQGVIVHVG